MSESKARINGAIVAAKPFIEKVKVGLLPEGAYKGKVVHVEVVYFDETKGVPLVAAHGELCCFKVTIEVRGYHIPHFTYDTWDLDTPVVTFIKHAKGPEQVYMTVPRLLPIKRGPGDPII